MEPPYRWDHDAHGTQICSLDCWSLLDCQGQYDRYSNPQQIANTCHRIHRIKHLVCLLFFYTKKTRHHSLISGFLRLSAINILRWSMYTLPSLGLFRSTWQCHGQNWEGNPSSRGLSSNHQHGFKIANARAPMMQCLTIPIYNTFTYVVLTCSGHGTYTILSYTNTLSYMEAHLCFEVWRSIQCLLAF